MAVFYVNDPMSITKYRSLTTKELLALADQRRGQSPIIDELAVRLEDTVDVDDDREFDIERMEGVLLLLEEHGINLRGPEEGSGALVFKPEAEIRQVLQSLKAKCGVCEAETTITLMKVDDGHKE